MSILLMLFIISGSLIALILIVQGIRVREHVVNTLPHAPAQAIKTNLDISIHEKLSGARQFILKLAHIKPEVIRANFFRFARAVIVVVLYVWSIIRSYIFKTVRKFQGNNVPTKKGSASFFLKEVSYFKDEVIEDSR